MWRRTAWSAAGILPPAASVPVLPAARAAAGCRASCAVRSRRTGGFPGAATMQNPDHELGGWSLSFAVPTSGQRLPQGWCGTWTQSGSTATVTSPARIGSLPTDQAVTQEFLGSWSETQPVARLFQLNRVAGGGGPVTSTAAPTPSAAPTASPTATPTPAATPTPPITLPGPPVGSAPALKISSDRVPTSAGAAYRGCGACRSGPELAGIEHRTGIWGGPMNQASVAAMRTWKVRAVRVPVNEECRLGSTSNLVPEYSGAAYQNAVKRYVWLPIANRVTPIVELRGSYSSDTGNSAGCPDVARAASCRCRPRRTRRPSGPPARARSKAMTRRRSTSSPRRIRSEPPAPEASAGNAGVGPAPGSISRRPDSRPWGRKLGRPAQLMSSCSPALPIRTT